MDGDVAWVVQSGDNTIGRLDVSTGRLDVDYIDIGDAHNPWDIASDGERLWISDGTGAVGPIDPALSLLRPTVTPVSGLAFDNHLARA